ncbi:hypothetical protein LA59_24915 [Vibrio harveyi]|nr:hypothetical protein LA59_24915 [Vibrio harveyi]
MYINALGVNVKKMLRLNFEWKMVRGLEGQKSVDRLNVKDLLTEMCDDSVSFKTRRSGWKGRMEP